MSPIFLSFSADFSSVEPKKHRLASTFPSESENPSCGGCTRHPLQKQRTITKSATCTPARVKSSPSSFFDETNAVDEEKKKEDIANQNTMAQEREGRGVCVC